MISLQIHSEIHETHVYKISKQIIVQILVDEVLHSATVERSCGSEKVSVSYMCDAYSGNTVQVPEVQLFPVAVAGFPQVVAQV